MKAKQRALKQAYQQTPRRAGIFQIRNLHDERVLLASGLDLVGIMNRHRFELEAGTHRNRTLQQDWQTLGAQGFAFEVLDELGTQADSSVEQRENLTLLETIWHERLSPYGTRGYNEPPLTRQQRLQAIMRKTAAPE